MEAVSVQNPCSGQQTQTARGFTAPVYGSKRYSIVYFEIIDDNTVVAWLGRRLQDQIETDPATMHIVTGRHRLLTDRNIDRLHTFAHSLVKAIYDVR